MIIVRYAEIGLKGSNRIMFENQLISNIKKSVGNSFKIQRLRSRILIDSDKTLDLSRIFGISSYSYAQKLPIDLEILKKESLKLAKNTKINKKKTSKSSLNSMLYPSTFRISCQRLDKSISMTSISMEKEIGEHVFENSDLKVNLKNPELNIQIELFSNHAYLFAEKIKGAGGLPLGSGGKVIASIENQKSIDSALAVMKRGCSVIPVAFKKFDLEKLAQYGLNEKLIIIKSFDEIENIAEQNNAKAIVSGQTLINFKELDTRLLTLRPLIAD